MANQRRDPELRPGADTRLTPLGLTEQQVQVVWMQMEDSRPFQSLPGSGSDAEVLATRLSQAARSIRQRYPNLRQVFVSSSIYGGYSTAGLNPEPFAYEGGFSVKWLIESQVLQMQSPTTCLPTL